MHLLCKSGCLGEGPLGGNVHASIERHVDGRT